MTQDTRHHLCWAFLTTKFTAEGEVGGWGAPPCGGRAALAKEFRPAAPQGGGHSPRLGLGKLSCSRKTTFSTKCWISHCSGPRTNTIQSCVNPSVVGFLRSWARCPSSNLTWTVHCGERGRRRVSAEPRALGCGPPPPSTPHPTPGGTQSPKVKGFGRLQLQGVGSTCLLYMLSLPSKPTQGPAPPPVTPGPRHRPSPLPQALHSWLAPLTEVLA